MIQDPPGAAILPDDTTAKDRTRDRPATERRILDAAQAILTAEGPSGFGVNAVARAAGVDKQLIYRYFGGLDGLLAALGARIGQWWQDRLMEGPSVVPPENYGALIDMLAMRLLHIMRSEPLAVQSALWELTDTSGLVRALSDSRAQALGIWMSQARGDLRPPEGVDAPAINAIVVAAISYLVLAGRTSGVVIGLATDGAATWRRIETALLALVRGVYGRA